MRNPPVVPSSAGRVGGLSSQPSPSEQVPSNISRLRAVFEAKEKAQTSPSGPPPPVSVGSHSINWGQIQARFGERVQRQGQPPPPTPPPPLDLSGATTAAPLETKAAAERLGRHAVPQETVSSPVPPPTHTSVPVAPQQPVPRPAVTSPSSPVVQHEPPQSTMFDTTDAPVRRRGDQSPKSQGAAARETAPTPALIVVPEHYGEEGVKLFNRLQELATRQGAAASKTRTDPQAAAKELSEIDWEYHSVLSHGSFDARLAVDSVKDAVLRRRIDVKAQALALQNAATDSLPPGNEAVKARAQRAWMAVDYLKTLEDLAETSRKPEDREILTSTRLLFHNAYIARAAEDAVQAGDKASIYSLSEEAAKTAPDDVTARSFHLQAANAAKAEAESLAGQDKTYRFYLDGAKNAYRLAYADPLEGEAAAAVAGQGVIDGMRDPKQASAEQEKITAELRKLLERAEGQQAANTIVARLRTSLRKEKELHLRVAAEAKSIRGKEGKQQVATATVKAAWAAVGYTDILEGTDEERRLAWQETKTLTRQAASLVASDVEKAQLFEEAANAVEEEIALSPPNTALSREATALQLEAARSWRQVGRDLHDKKGATPEDLRNAADARTSAAVLFEKAGKKTEALDCYQKSARNFLQSVVGNTKTEDLNGLLQQLQLRELWRPFEGLEPQKREWLLQNLDSLRKMDNYDIPDILSGLGANMVGEAYHKNVASLYRLIDLPPADRQALIRLNQDRARQQPPPEPLKPMSPNDVEAMAIARRMMVEVDRLAPSAEMKQIMVTAKKLYDAVEVRF